MIGKFIQTRYVHDIKTSKLYKLNEKYLIKVGKFNISYNL